MRGRGIMKSAAAWNTVSTILLLGSLLAAPRSTFSMPKGDGLGRQRLGSKFYTSAASQSSGAGSLSKQESQLLRKVQDAAVHEDWLRIQSLRATSKVFKAQFFDAEMDAALKCGQYKAGVALYERLCDLKLNREVLSFNLAMKLYGKTGQWSSVQQTWKEARAKYSMDETMAAARLVAAADEGDINTTAAILDEMAQMKLKHDVGHFTSALRSCTAAEHKAYNVARYLFECMLNMSLAPDAGVFAALVSTYGNRPVREFRSLRTEMDTLAVKPNWIFADAYLKALLGVRQTSQADRKHSTSELADLTAKASRERLREAANALSELNTMEDELSSFCQLVDLALKRQASSKL